MTRTRRILLTVATVAVVAFDVAVALAIMARSRGVEAVAIPPASLIGVVAQDADYAAAYYVPVSRLDFPSVAVIDAITLGGANEVVGRAPTEVVYRGHGPGLDYHMGYLLRDAAGRRTLTVTTAVHYRNVLGRLYFALARVADWSLLPLAMSQWASTT